MPQPRWSHNSRISRRCWHRHVQISPETRGISGWRAPLPYARNSIHWTRCAGRQCQVQALRWMQPSPQHTRPRCPLPTGWMPRPRAKPAPRASAARTTTGTSATCATCRSRGKTSCGCWNANSPVPGARSPWRRRATVACRNWTPQTRRKPGRQRQTPAPSASCASCASGKSCQSPTTWSPRCAKNSAHSCRQASAISSTSADIWTRCRSTATSTTGSIWHACATRRARTPSGARRCSTTSSTATARVSPPRWRRCSCTRACWTTHPARARSCGSCWRSARRAASDRSARTRTR